MADWEVKAATEQEGEIICILRALEENPQSVDQFAKLIRLANLYVQENADVNQPQESLFKPHQLCSKCVTRRSVGDPDYEREKKMRFRLQVCMLRALSFKLNRVINIWLEGLYLTVNDCIECYKGFVRVKSEIGPLFLHTFEQDRVLQFLLFAEEWEEGHALAMLEERDISGNMSKSQLSPSELYAVLALSGALAARDERNGLYKTLKSKRTKLRLDVLSEAPSGLLAFAIDEDQNVRSWAEMQGMIPPMSREMGLTKTTQKLLSLGIERKEWNGVAFLLKMAPDSLTGSVLPNTLVTHLSDGNHSVSVFHFFSRVLEIGRWQLWEGEDGEYPLVVLTTILDDAHYRSCLAQPNPAPEFFAWMWLFLESLNPQPHEQSDEESRQEGEGKTRRVLADALKRMVYFLVETMQQSQVSFECRKVAFSEAVVLLRHLLQLGDDQQGEGGAECSRIAAQVATLHASLLANYALRGRIPNSAETVPTDSPSRQSALELIQNIFERDCSHLSDSLLLFSKAAVGHQAMYKRLCKEHGARGDRDLTSPEASKEVDEVFQATEKSLDVQPWISSDLWRESYHAFRPTEDIGLFIHPLARLSTFVQPQINSHIIACKSHHLNRPTFLAYKDRLKAGLLILSRRLRSMRGSLSQVLLDVSDEDSAQSSASQALSTMSYTRADSIIQASLCPEPEIYKAAQNVVRATFEEAETRADCFRALIECSPTRSLQGIQAYLESFLIAASTLVEANDAAKWMVRSFSDVLDVFCSPTDGLLRIGTPHSLVDNGSVKPHVRRLLPSIWQLMCRSIAVIFKRTPSWSRVLPHAELTAWFRDVLLFASDLVDQVAIIQAAATHDGQGDDEEQVQAGVLTDLAIPLEEASSWLRMNDSEIVAGTRDYFVKGLRCFNGKVTLPESVKQRMLAFIDGQRKIEDSNARMTLLTLRELSDLRHLLDPRSVIEIEDSDEEDVEAMVHTPPPREQTQVQTQTLTVKPAEKKAVADASHGVADVAAAKKAKEQQQRLRQQKLAFQTVDSASSRPFVTKPAPKPAPKPPGPQFAVPASGHNRYQSATARSTSSAVPRSSSSAFAEARRNFNAASPWKQLNSIIPRPSHTGSARELPDPQAPAAKRSFTGVPISTHETRPPAAQETESSESESEDEKEALGLADLVGVAKSPIKMRPKPKMPPKAPGRRTVLMEDLEAKRRQREREEAERKRKLRERANLGPLHRSILSWDFYADSPRPPLPPNVVPPRYDTVKTVYKSPEEYVDVFGPMMLLECWAEFQGARDQIGKGGPEDTFSFTVSGRSATDDFVTITATLSPQATKLLKPFQETDVVYVREPGQSQRPRAIVAKVDAFKFHSQGHLLTLKCCLQADTQGMTSLLVAGTKLEMGRLFSLTTVHREYEALQVMQHYDLVPSILQARCAVKETVGEAEVIETTADYGVNRPQAEAILAALQAEQGFSLIQGPPGTGKTKTICSLVACFIQTRKAPAVPIRAGQTGAGVGVKKKILLCAPSNAAVDEVAKRVNEGVRLKSGKVIKPQVVRLGREDALNVSVKSFSLDRLVENKLAASTSASSSQPDPSNDPSKILAEIRNLKDGRDAKRAEVENARVTEANSKVIAQLDAEMRSISVRRMNLMSKLDEVKDNKQTMDRKQTADRKRMEQAVMAEADVICSTLGGAGHNSLLELPFDFETVVIDEAAQAVELDTLIPLRYGCQRCILVGDPNQLPPTVLSQEAERLNYAKSLFVRLFNNPRNVSHLLSIQYRMHPTISNFPSAEFYQGKLIDGPGMAALTAKPWHNDPLLAPFRFFHCQKSQESSGRGTSLRNREEARMAAAIYERLRKEAHRFGAQSVEGKVGVVTMYKDQVWELQQAFRSLYGKGIEDVVDFNTVDGFQGQEKDVIILSCVRSQGFGFLDDFRRVNVAITRAKSNLFIVGNVNNLERGRGVWPKLIAMAKEQKSLMEATTEMFKKNLPAIQAVSPAKASQTVQPSPSPSSNGTSASSAARSLAAAAMQSPIKRKASVSTEGQQGPNKRANVEGRPLPAPYALPPGPPPRPSGSVKGARPPVQRPPTAHRPPPRPVARPARPAQAPPEPRPRPSAGVPILPPGPIANAPQPLPRPVQLHRPPPAFSSQQGPSDRARSSLFIQKPLRAERPKRGR